MKAVGLRVERRKLVTLTELASELGMDYRTLSDIENGLVDITESQYEAIVRTVRELAASKREAVTA